MVSAGAKSPARPPPASAGSWATSAWRGDVTPPELTHHHPLVPARAAQEVVQPPRCRRVESEAELRIAADGGEHLMRRVGCLDVALRADGRREMAGGGALGPFRDSSSRLV